MAGSSPEHEKLTDRLKYLLDKNDELKQELQVDKASSFASLPYGDGSGLAASSGIPQMASLQAHVARLQQQNRELLETNRLLEDDLAHERESVAQALRIHDLRDVHSRGTEAVALLETENRRLKGRVETLEAAAHKDRLARDNLHTEVLRLQRDNESLRKHNEELNSALERASSTASHQAAQLTQSAGRVSSEDYQRVLMDAESLRKQMVELRSTFDRELESTVREKNKLKDDMYRIEQDYMNKLSDLEGKYVDRFSRDKEREADLNKQREDTLRLLDEQTKQTADVHAMCAQLKADNSKLREDLAEARAMRDVMNGSDALSRAATSSVQTRIHHDVVSAQAAEITELKRKNIELMDRVLAGVHSSVAEGPVRAPSRGADPGSEVKRLEALLREANRRADKAELDLLGRREESVTRGDRTNSKVTMLESENHTLSERVRFSEGELKNVRRMMEEQRAEHQSRLSAALRDVSEAHAALEKQQRVADDLRAQLEGTIRSSAISSANIEVPSQPSSKPSLSPNNKAQAQVDVLKWELDAARNQLQAYQHRYESLNDNYNKVVQERWQTQEELMVERNSLSTQLRTIQADFDAAQMRLHVKNGEVEELRNENNRLLENINRLQDELDKQFQRLRSFDPSVDAAKQNMQSPSLSSRQLQERTQSDRQLQAMVESLTEEKDFLSRQVKALQIDLQGQSGAFELERAAHMNEVDSLQSQMSRALHEATVRRAELDKETYDLKREIGNLGSSNEQLRIAKNAAEKLKDEALRRLEVLQGRAEQTDLARLESERAVVDQRAFDSILLDEKNAELEVAHSKIESMKKAHSALSADYDVMADELKAVRAEKDNNLRSLLETQRRLDKEKALQQNLVSELRTAKKSFDELSREAQRSIANAESRAHEIVALNRSLRDREEDYHREKTRADRAEGQALSLRSEVDNLKKNQMKERNNLVEEVSTLQHGGEALAQTVNQLQAEVDTARAENSRLQRLHDREVDSMNVRIKMQEDELQQMESKAVEASKNEATARKSVNEALTEVAARREEVETLHRRCTEAESELGTAKRDVDTMRFRLEEVTRNAELNVNSLKQDIARKEARIIECQEVISRVQFEFEQAIQKTETTNSGLQQRVASIKREAEERSQSEISAVKAHYENMEKELFDKVRREVAAIQDDRDDLAAQLQAAEALNLPLVEQARAFHAEGKKQGEEMIEYLRKLTQEHEKLTLQCNDYAKQLEELNAALSREQDGRADLQREVHETKLDHVSTESKQKNTIYKLEGEVSTLTQQLDDSRLMCTKLEADLRESEKKGAEDVKELGTRVIQVSDELEEAFKENQLLKDQLQALDDEMKSTKDDFSSQRTALMNELQMWPEMKKEWEARFSEAESTITGMHKALKDAELEVAALNETLRVKDSENEVAIDRLESAERNAKETIDTMQRRLKEIQSESAEQVMAQKEEIQSLTLALSKVENENRELRVSIPRAEDSQKQIEELLKEKIAEKKRYLAETEELRDRNNDLERKVRAHDDKVKYMQTQADEFRTEIMNMNATISELQADKDRATSEMSSLHMQIANLKNQVQQVEASALVDKEQAAGLEDAKSSMAMKMQEAEESHRIEMETIQGEVRNAMAQVAKALEERDVLERLNADLSQKCKLLSEERDALRLTTESLGQRVDENAINMEDQVSRISSIAFERQKISGENTRLLAEVETYKNKYEAASANITDLQMMVKRVRDEKEALKLSLSRAQAAGDDLDKSSAIRLAEVEKRAEELRRQNISLQDELSMLATNGTARAQDKTNHEMEHIRTQLQQHQALIDTLQNQRASLLKQNSALENMATELKRTHHDADVRSAGLSTYFEQANSAAVSAMEQLQKENEQLNSSLRSVRRELAITTGMRPMVDANGATNGHSSPKTNGRESSPLQ